MSEVSQAVIDRIAKEISESISITFSSMMMMEATFTGMRKNDGSIQLLDDLTAVINLTSKDFQITLLQHYKKDMALTVGNALLMDTIQEIDDDIKDACLEISNMVGGGLKKSFAEIDFTLSLPTLFTGDSIQATSKTCVKSYLIPVQSPKGEFVQEFVVKS